MCGVVFNSCSDCQRSPRPLNFGSRTGTFSDQGELGFVVLTLQHSPLHSRTLYYLQSISLCNVCQPARYYGERRIAIKLPPSFRFKFLLSQ